MPVSRLASTQPSDGFPTLHTLATVNSMTQPTPATVLVVEDDLDLRATIVESLEMSGFAAAQASDAADAIDRLQGFAYDGLVVDLKLPDADGGRGTGVPVASQSECPCSAVHQGEARDVEVDGKPTERPGTRRAGVHGGNPG